MKLTVLPWVLGATVDGGLDSRLRGNDGSQVLQRLKRDCPVPEGRTIAKSPSRMIEWESDGRNFPVSTFSVAEISPLPLRQAQVNLCVACDPTRGEEVLGRNSMPETDVYSTCCAVQNLRLATRAEGVGVGWVGILKLPLLRRILGIPPHIVPVAYLCLGYPEEFAPEPLLQKTGWRERLPLEELVHYDGWGGRQEAGNWERVREALSDCDDEGQRRPDPLLPTVQVT